MRSWTDSFRGDLLMFLATIPPPPFNSFELGPLTVRIYGLAIAAGVLTAVWLARKRYAKAGGDPEFLDRVAIWVVLGGIVGARLGFVLPRLDRFSDDPAEAFAVWEGGLTFFGGLVGGGAAGLFLLVRNHARIGMMLTAVAPAIPLAQAIGRLGNYFNQELYGEPSDLPWALEVEPGHRMPGFELYETFHPTFAYEIIWNVALVGVLLWAGSKLKLRPGSLFLMYLVGYGIGRFLLELIRIDTEARILGLSRNAYNSLIIVLLGAAALWWRESKGGGPEDSYLDRDGSEAGDPDTTAESESDEDEDEADGEAESGAEASDEDTDGDAGEEVSEVGAEKAEEGDGGAEPGDADDGTIALGHRPQFVAVPGDDEQGVVDADPDGHEHDGRGPELGDVHAVGGQHHHGDAGGDPEQRRDQRERHGEHGAEGHQEDHHRSQETDRFGGRVLLLEEHLAAQIDLDLGRHVGVGPHCCHLVGPAEGVVLIRFVEQHLGEGDLPAGCDLGITAFVVGAEDAHLGDSGGHVGEEALHGGPDRGVVDTGGQAVIHPEDDLPGVAAAVAQATLLQQVVRVLALGAGDGEVVTQLTAGDTGKNGETGGQSDPAEDDVPATPITQAGEAGQRPGPRGTGGFGGRPGCGGCR
jgi:prolipoprotein diacylglyceryl transferase